MRELPIISFPTSIVCVDDDDKTLEVIKNMLAKRHYATQTFNDAKQALQFLTQYVSRLDAKTFLSAAQDCEYVDNPSATTTRCDIRKITDLASISLRHQEIGVLIIDYDMPCTNGIELCSKLKNHPYKKILLTGAANPQQALAALNDQIIDAYISKSTPELESVLLAKVKELEYKYFLESTHGIGVHLAANGLSTITDGVFIEFFTRWCSEHNIQEYYLLDKNGSLLLIDGNNERSCLIVHTDASLTEFVKDYTDDERAQEFIAAIVNRSMMPCFTGSLNINGVNDIVRWGKWFRKPNYLQGNVNYYWCHYPLVVI